MDKIILRGIPFNFVVAQDAWGREKPQPVSISLEIPFDVRESAANDDVSRTLDYGKLYKSLTQNLVGGFLSVAHLIIGVRQIVSTDYCHVAVAMPKANLRAEGGLHLMYDFSQGGNDGVLRLMQSLSIRGIRCACIVGVNKHERETKQIVGINLDFKRSNEVESNNEALLALLNSEVKGNMAQIANKHRALVQGVAELVEGSAYQTVEALATAIAKIITVTFDVPAVWVEVEKPNAVAAVEAAGVRIYREQSFFTESNFWQIRQP